MIQALIIESVSAFVDTTEEAGLQFTFMYPSCHPNVGGVKRCGERMGGEVQSAT